jgi:beta-N-acetylhexosaminidase
MTLGPVMLDIDGTELTPEDRELLRHPNVGGVILFTRNYDSPQQLQQLNREIHALRRPELVIAVDQEGGRVQRFRAGFTPLPAMHLLGRHYELERERALRLAETCGWLMAAELRAVGVDLSFAPCSTSTTASARSSAIARFTATPKSSRDWRAASPRACGMRAWGPSESIFPATAV